MSADPQPLASATDYFSALQAAWIGRWAVRSRAWPAGRTGAIVEDAATASVEAVAGGKSLLVMLDGTQFGAPVRGAGLYTLDERRGKVVSAWTDSSTAALFLAEGHFTPDGRMLRSFGRADGPGASDFDRWWRVELEVGRELGVRQRYMDLSASGGGELLIEIEYRVPASEE